MTKNLNNQVPKDLFAKVMFAIETERGLVAMRLRFAGFALVCLAIAALSIPVWHSFRTDIATSGLDQFVRLAFSDFRTAMTDWQDFSLTLLESLPIISTVGLLGIILSFLVTLKFAIKYSKNIFNNSLAH